MTLKKQNDDTFWDSQTGYYFTEDGKCISHDAVYRESPPNYEVADKIQAILNKPHAPVLTADPINPAHYQQNGIETIDVIEAWELGYCLGNAVKYISRAGKKDPTKEVEDLKKAIWYIERRIKELSE